MYYVIDANTDENGNIMGVTYEKDHHGRSWVSGNRFSSAPDSPVFKQHPKEPLKVYIKKGRENDPLANYLHEPLPIISKKLLDTIRSAGVDNIDVYKIDLYFPDGSLASENHYAFNLVGKIAAVDLEKSIYDEDQPDSIISMSFDSLVVDEEKTKSLLMFRLVENITTILVHEKVKNAVENAHIEYVRFFDPPDIGIL